jgi:chromosome segregation ATPase
MSNKVQTLEEARQANTERLEMLRVRLIELTRQQEETTREIEQTRLGIERIAGRLDILNQVRNEENEDAAGKVPR